MPCESSVSAVRAVRCCAVHALCCAVFLWCSFSLQIVIFDGEKAKRRLMQRFLMVKRIVNGELILHHNTFLLPSWPSPAGRKGIYAQICTSCSVRF